MLMDATYILRIMYDLNVLPLALQITNICGNVMVRNYYTCNYTGNKAIIDDRPSLLIMHVCPLYVWSHDVLCWLILSYLPMVKNP